MPFKLVMGTAVYSLGLIGGLKAMFKSFSRGEVSDLTSLIYDAREHAIGLIKREAEAIGADDVVGVKTHIHELGGLIEFMAIGTAVKRVPGIATAHAHAAAAGDHQGQGHLDQPQRQPNCGAAGQGGLRGGKYLTPRPPIPLQHDLVGVQDAAKVVVHRRVIEGHRQHAVYGGAVATDQLGARLAMA